MSDYTNNLDPDTIDKLLDELTKKTMFAFETAKRIEANSYYMDAADPEWDSVVVQAGHLLYDMRVNPVALHMLMEDCGEDFEDKGFVRAVNTAATVAFSDLKEAHPKFNEENPTYDAGISEWWYEHTNLKRDGLRWPEEW